MALLALSFFALRPLLSGFMFASADGLFHVYRLVEFDRVLRAGVPYPRWAPDLMAGYGYPVFTFYAPLEFYLGSALHLAGLSFVASTKAVVALGIVASLAGMYLLGREWWGRLGGVIAAVSYLYAPYRLVNTYLDGELSQTLAWAWLPWLFWACWRGLHARTPAARWRYRLLATLCTAGLLYTHSVMSWLTALLLGLWLAGLLVLRLARVHRVVWLGGALLLGVGLAALYWLPALAEQGLVQLQRARAGTWDFHLNFLPLARTLSTQLAHQYQGYAGVNGPAQLGLVQALVALIGLLALPGLALATRDTGPRARAVSTSGATGHGMAPPAKISGRSRLGLLLAALAAAFFVLMLAPSVVFWDHFPFGSFLQFPDRLLAPIAFCLAALSGGLGPLLERWAWPGEAAAAAICGLLIYGGAANLRVSSIALPAHLGPQEVVEYEQQTGTSGSALSEFAPKTIGTPPVGSALVPRYLDGQLPSRAPTGALARGRPVLGANFSVHSLSAHPITVPLAFFPGWGATVNGHAAALHATPQGLDELQLPSGRAQVRIFPSATPDRLAATAIALGSALTVLALALLERRWRGARPTDGAGKDQNDATLQGGAAIDAESASHPATLWGRAPVAAWGGRGSPLEVRPESHWRPSADPLSLQLASSIGALEEPHPGRRGRFPAELLARLTSSPGLVVPGLLALGCVLAAVIAGLHSSAAAAPSPASRPLDVAYDNGLILRGSDVQVTGANLHATLYFREPATPVALTGELRLTTLGQHWASA
ncbi:MAG TPA: 6-pyruvoyl-tetrahydropterin synthase-related protein, partial [Chloroflexota bacterium]|nr:6-pyruvoyl-tetrahydropterin synthase-related protein [Chloroflexota bacterium]